MKTYILFARLRLRGVKFYTVATIVNISKVVRHTLKEFITPLNYTAKQIEYITTLVNLMKE